MNLEENVKMLENIIKEIRIVGHNENLLQQLIRCYLDIYLAKDYEKIGGYIDTLKKDDENRNSKFFGQIIKTGKGTSAEDNGLGSRFTNGFRSVFVRFCIKENKSLKQIYTSLGVLDENQEQAGFWWNKVVNALADFEFEDLCQIVPNKDVTDGSLQICFVREKDLRTLLSEKGISEENYTINYGTMFSSKIFIVGDPVDDMFLDELNKQRQKGLYLTINQKEVSSNPK